jgi:hypothetical protein
MSDDGLTEALRLQGWNDAADLIEQYENEKVLSKAAYEGMSSLLLSVQKDCIAEKRRADIAEATLKNVVRKAAAICTRIGNDGLTQAAKEHAQWMKATADDCARSILAELGPRKYCKGTDSNIVVTELQSKAWHDDDLYHMECMTCGQEDTCLARRPSEVIMKCAGKE